MLTLLARFFKREGDFSFWRNIILIAVISGMAHAGLLAIINNAAHGTEDKELNYFYLFIYIIVFIIFFVSKKISMVKTTSEIERIARDLRARIFDKIQKSELLTIESIEKSTIFTKFTRDGAIITQSSNMLVSAVQSTIMLFFAFIYILIISPLIFYVIIFSIIFTIIMYSYFIKELNRDITIGNIEEEKFFNSLNSILMGFKELKMNYKKSEDISKKQNIVLNNLLRLRVNLSNKIATSMLFTEMFSYLLLGIIIFVVAPLVSGDSIAIIQITAILLFVMGPIESIISIAPMGMKTISSIQSLFELEDMLDNKKYINDMTDDSIIKRFNNLKEIKLSNINFYYRGENMKKTFGISSINLTIKRGNIIFIIGGNGSGKSTLLKTLLGIYPSEKGLISIDGENINIYNQQVYKDMFSIILTDFYLIDSMN